MKDLYDVLGVPRTANGEDIKRAYRRKSQKAHPDKGGDTEQFQEVAKAYNILSDATKRDYYDKTGEERTQRAGQEAIGILLQIVMDLCRGHDVARTNIVELVKRILNDQQNRHEQNKIQIITQAARLRSIAARFIAKENVENLISSGIVQEAEKLESQALNIDDMIETGKKLLLIIEEYSYRVDPIHPYIHTSQFGSGTTTSTNFI